MKLTRIFLCCAFLLEFLTELLWAQGETALGERLASSILRSLNDHEFDYDSGCIIVNPHTLNFPESYLYSPQKLSLTIINLAQDALGHRCSEAHIVHLESDDEQFQIAPGSSQNKIIEPGEEIEITTLFVPRREGLQHGTLIIVTNHHLESHSQTQHHTINSHQDTQHSHEIVEIDCQGVGLENLFQVVPFVETLPVGMSRSWPVTIFNPHDEQMVIQDVKTTSTLFVIGESSEVDNTWIIGAGESAVIVQLSCHMNKSDTFSGYVVIVSNLVEVQIPILITAKTGIEFHPSRVNFGALTSQNQNRSRIIKLENFHNEPVSILDIRLREPDERISLAFDSDLIIQPASRAEVCQVSFVATETQKKFDGELLIYTSITHEWQSSPGVTFARELVPLDETSKPVSIPYSGRVLYGSLVYTKNTVSFEVVMDDETSRPSVVSNEVRLRNAFEVPLHISDVQVSDELLEILEFQPKIAQPDEQFGLCTIEFRPNCMNLRYQTDLRLQTNVSVLHIPLTIYNGGLHVTSTSDGVNSDSTAKFSLTRRSDGSGYIPRFGREGFLSNDKPVDDKIYLRLDDLFDAQLDFGNVVMEEKYEHALEFVNDSPNDVVIREVSTSADMILAIFVHSTGPSYEIVMLPKQRETLIVKLQVPQGEEMIQHSRIVEIETSAQTFRIDVSFKPIMGFVTFESIQFGSAFPGIVLNETLKATSSFRYPVTLRENVETQDPRFSVVITKSEIPAKATVEVGYILFDPSKCARFDNYMDLTHPDVLWRDFSHDEYPTREEYTLMQRSKEVWGRLQNERKISPRELIKIEYEEHNRISEGHVDVSSSLEMPDVLSTPYLATDVVKVGEQHTMVVPLQNPTDRPVSIEILPLVQNDYIKALSMGSEENMLPDPKVLGSFFRIDLDVRSSSVNLPARSTGTIGPVYFKPTRSGKVKTVLYLRNNLTYLSTLDLYGEGGEGRLEVISENSGVKTLAPDDSSKTKILAHTPSGCRFHLEPNFEALGIDPANGTFVFKSPDSYEYNKTAAVMRIPFSLKNSGNLPMSVQNFVLGNVEDDPPGSLSHYARTTSTSSGKNVRENEGCYGHVKNGMLTSSLKGGASGHGLTSIESSFSIISSFFSVFYPPPPKNDGKNLGYGFHIHGCGLLPMIINPGHSSEFLLEYQPDFHAQRVDTQLLVKTDYGDYNIPVTVSIPSVLVPMLLALQPLSEREIMIRRVLLVVVVMVFSLTWWNVLSECRLYRKEMPRFSHQHQQRNGGQERDSIMNGGYTLVASEERRSDEEEEEEEEDGSSPSPSPSSPSPPQSPSPPPVSPKRILKDEPVVEKIENLAGIRREKRQPPRPAPSRKQKEKSERSKKSHKSKRRHEMNKQKRHEESSSVEGSSPHHHHHHDRHHNSNSGTSSSISSGTNNSSNSSSSRSSMAIHKSSHEKVRRVKKEQHKVAASISQKKREAERPQPLHRSAPSRLKPPGSVVNTSQNTNTPAPPVPNRVVNSVPVRPQPPIRHHNTSPHRSGSSHHQNTHDSPVKWQLSPSVHYVPQQPQSSTPIHHHLSSSSSTTISSGGTSLFDSSPHSNEPITREVNVHNRTGELATSPMFSVDKCAPQGSQPTRPRGKSDPLRTSSDLGGLGPQSLYNLDMASSMGGAPVKPPTIEDIRYKKLRGNAFGPYYESRHQTSPVKRAQTRPGSRSPATATTAATSASSGKWQQKTASPARQTSPQNFQKPTKSNLKDVLDQNSPSSRERSPSAASTDSFVSIGRASTSWSASGGSSSSGSSSPNLGERFVVTPPLKQHEKQQKVRTARFPGRRASQPRAVIQNIVSGGHQINRAHTPPHKGGTLMTQSGRRSITPDAHMLAARSHGSFHFFPQGVERGAIGSERNVSVARGPFGGLATSSSSGSPTKMRDAWMRDAMGGTGGPSIRQRTESRYEHTRKNNDTDNSAESFRLPQGFNDDKFEGPFGNSTFFSFLDFPKGSASPRSTSSPSGPTTTQQQRTPPQAPSDEDLYLAKYKNRGTVEGGTPKMNAQMGGGDHHQQTTGTGSSIVGSALSGHQSPASSENFGQYSNFAFLESPKTQSGGSLRGTSASTQISSSGGGMGGSGSHHSHHGGASPQISSGSSSAVGSQLSSLRSETTFGAHNRAVGRPNDISGVVALGSSPRSSGRLGSALGSSAFPGFDSLFGPSLFPPPKQTHQTTTLPQQPQQKQQQAPATPQPQQPPQQPQLPQQQPQSDQEQQQPSFGDTQQQQQQFSTRSGGYQGTWDQW